MTETEELKARIKLLEVTVDKLLQAIEKRCITSLNFKALADDALDLQLNLAYKQQGIVMNRGGSFP